MTEDKKKERVLILELDGELAGQVEAALRGMDPREARFLIVEGRRDLELRGAFRVSALREAARELAVVAVRREEITRGLKEIAAQIVVPVAEPEPRKKQPKPVPRKKKGIINPRGQRRG